MKILKDKIIEKGRIVEGDVVKVDSFLNHQIDINLMRAIGEEFKERFKDVKIDKILTAEVSGIAIGTMVAHAFDLPMVFARKTESKNMSKDKWTTDVYSYTKDRVYEIMVSKEYLKEGENILIVDDFLANGYSAEGLVKLVEKAGAKTVGVGVVIEKGFQDGGKKLREAGIRLESLAIIDKITEEGIEFR